jgi:hypothetical protein
MSNPNLGRKGITESQLRGVLKKCAANLSATARELGCDRSNVEQRIKRSPDLQAFVAGIHREIEDLADGVIVTTLNDRSLNGRPSSAAQQMARWHKDHLLRREGILLRLADKDGQNLSAPGPTDVHLHFDFSGDDVV